MLRFGALVVLTLPAAAQTIPRALPPVLAPSFGLPSAGPALAPAEFPALTPVAPAPALMDVPPPPRPGAGSPAEAPSSDLSGLLGPAGRQGSERNTCSVFAAAGLGEAVIRKAGGEDFKISEQHLYYSAKRDYLDSPELLVYRSIDGLAGFTAVKALQGPLLAERDWPYSERRPAARGGYTGRPPAGTEPLLRRDLRFMPVAVDRARIKDYLASEGRPVVFNIMVYHDAVDHETGRMRDPTDEERRLCRESGQGCAGHVVLITGWDAAAGEYLFRNSWGPDWGDRGYGRLSERAVLEDCELCRHLANIDALSEADRRMVLDGVRGWSAELH